MPQQRSTATLIAVILWLAAGFFAVNYIISEAEAGAWVLPLGLFLLGALLIALTYRPRTGQAAETAAADEVPVMVGQRPPAPALTAPPPAPVPTSTAPAPPPTPAPTPAAPAPQPAPTPTPAPTSEVTAPPPAPAPTSEAPAPIPAPVALEPDMSTSAERSVSQQPGAREAEIEEVRTTPDDLTRIEGIGPKMAAALISAGLDTFGKVAAASEDDLRTAIEAAGMRFSPSLVTWSAQARFAAEGDWTGFANYQSTLRGGRPRD